MVKTVSSGEGNLGQTEHRRNPRQADGRLDLDYPRFSTRRFQFRPFVLADIQRLVSLAGEHRIAATTIGIPHPYTSEFARMWILTHADSWEKGEALHWAVQGGGRRANLGVCRLESCRPASWSGGVTLLGWFRCVAQSRCNGMGESHHRVRVRAHEDAACVCPAAAATPGQRPRAFSRWNATGRACAKTDSGGRSRRGRGLLVDIK